MCTDCPSETPRSPTGSASSSKCTINCYSGFYGNPGATPAVPCTACGAGTYSAREGATACTTCAPGKYSAGGADMCITFVSECCSAVDQLGDEFERLKQLMTLGSSFITTGNRTMPAWGKSGYSRCQLPFSWTELIKVLSFILCYPIVSLLFCISSNLFH